MITKICAWKVIRVLQSSSSRGTQYDERHESRRYDERNSRSSQEDQEVGLGQEYQKEVRVGQEDLIHIGQPRWGMWGYHDLL